MGEVHRLSLNPDSRLCGCGAPIEECVFWSRMLDELSVVEDLDRAAWADQHPVTIRRERPAGGIRDLGVLEGLLLFGSWRILEAASRWSTVCRRHIEMAGNSWRLYDVVGSVTGARLVVDSTKNAARMKLLYMCRPAETRIVHLVRDGRAVASSARRREGIPIREGARRWYRANRNVELAMRTIPEHAIYLVRYEDLCDQTERVMSTLCAFIGIQPSQSMFSLQPHDYHQIPGNPMLFRDEDTSIVRDDAWRDGFDSSDQREFDAVAGEMNRRYGYDADPTA